MILGPRGSGKGTAYNALAHCGDRLLRDARYVGQFFATFAFSFEIASVWDALLSFLDEPRISPRWFGHTRSPNSKKGTAGTVPETVLSKDEPQRREALRELARVDALRLTLKRRCELRKEKERLLIVFNAFDILLNREGIPKNSEIAQILDLLLGSTSESAPIDIICICRNQCLPNIYRKKASAKHYYSFPKGFLPRRSLSLILSDRQAKLESNDPFSIRVRRDFIETIETSQVNLNSAAAPEGSPSGSWLARDLIDRGLIRSAQQSHDYLYIPDLSKPGQFYWPPTDGETHQKLLESSQAALRIVDRDDLSQGEALDRLFYIHLERNRFLYSLLIGIARQAGPDKILGFLRTVIPVLQTPGIPVQDRFIEYVLDFWYEEWAKEPDPRNPSLYEALLRHLAVISTPVDAEVLSWCPKIQSLLDAESKVDPKTAVAKALEGLATRGLVFRLRPRDPDSDRRYAVHRTIQRYMFRRLGSQRLEPSEGQLFTLSLYAAQQRQYPKLSANAYEFIYELVAHLTAYQPLRTPKHPNRDFASRCLRAALGVIRNLFSVAVVSRFSDLGDGAVSKVEGLGYFEHHRFIVRWLLYYASDLTQERPGRSRLEEWAPFYRDDIVWLANECAVFSLTQGKTHDASALFWLAGRSARGIEGRSSGAMRHRILLNDAWCCIERGRLLDAEAKFQEVIGASPQERLLHVLADGGLGVVEHARGHFGAAKARYDEAIEELQHLHVAKPLGLFLRLRGDLHRHMGRHEKARNEFQKSLQIAKTEGYFELVYDAEVSIVRNDIAAGRADPAHVAKILDVAHGYAQKMDLVRLLCEVLRARTELLMGQGQESVARPFIIRAIRIATLNGLTLRKLGYMTLFASIEAARGNLEAANRLHARLVETAGHLGFNIEHREFRGRAR
jgi:tetratricopeptide (TPR) repeat protein